MYPAPAEGRIVDTVANPDGSPSGFEPDPRGFVIRTGETNLTIRQDPRQSSSCHSPQ